jgi:hypothetical protein
MLYGIEMDVVEVPLKIHFVGDCMFPVFCLPNAATAILFPTNGPRPLARLLRKPRLCEFLLDPSPSARICTIAVWKSPDAVQMIGQEDNRICHEWPSKRALSDDSSKKFTGTVVAEQRPPAVGNDGEEECSARNVGAPPIRHGSKCCEPAIRPAQPALQESSEILRTLDGGFAGAHEVGVGLVDRDVAVVADLT